MNRCKLTVLAFLLTISTLFVAVPNALAWDPPAGGLDFMNVLVDKVILDNHKLAVGDQIGVFAEGGVLAGLGVVEDPNAVIGFAVYGDDPIQQDRQGFFANEALTFKIWDNVGAREVAADVTWSDSPVTYRRDTVLRVQLAGGVGAPSIVVSAMDRDFGAVKLGTNARWLLRITNAGRANLAIASLISDNQVFTTDFGAQAIQLAAGASKDVTVTFAPTNAVDFTGKLTIASNDAVQSSLVVNVAGSGSAVTPADCRLSTSSRSFGQVVVNEQATWTLRIGNVGDQDMTITAITLPAESRYSTNFGAQPVVVKKNEVISVVVTYAPNAAGLNVEDMVIDIGKGVGNPKVRLRGEGIVIKNPNLILGNVGVKANAYSLYMGNVISGMSYTHHMILSNAANAEGDLNVTGIAIDGAVFTVEFPVAGLRLRPGDSYKIPVTFKPTAVRAYAATMTISSNQPAAGRDVDVQVALAGQGGDPNNNDLGYFRYNTTEGSHSLLVTEAKLDGNLLSPGDEIGIYMPSGICAGSGTIRREGAGVRATVTAWADDARTAAVDGFLADQIFVFKVWAAEDKVEAVAQATFTAGPEVFTLNNGDTQLKLEAVKPTDVPKIAIDPIDLPYVQVLVQGSIIKKSFTITNNGGKVLTIADIVADMPVFTTNFNVATNKINPGSSLAIEASFDPAEERNYRGRLTITSDDPINPTMYVDVRGEGVATVDPQKLQLSVAAVNYGVVKPGTVNNFPIMISNIGSGNAIIHGISYAGDPVIGIDWTERTTLGAGDYKILNVKYSPLVDNNNSGTITIRWNDPRDVNLNGSIVVKVFGQSKTFDGRWSYAQTQATQWVRAISYIGENPITTPGSEIGVFTADGFCAGRGVINDDPNVKFEIYGDNAATEMVEGLKANERLTFRVWDRKSWNELTCTPEYIGGPDRFQAGKTTIVKLMSAAPPAPKLTASPKETNFGPSHLNKDGETRTYKIFNPEADSPVKLLAVESSHPTVYKVTWADANRVLNQNDTTFVRVTFNPKAVEVYMGTIALYTDKGVFTFYAKGFGGTGDHWAYYPTETNHTLLLTNLKFGDELAEVGDEVAIFRPQRLCAGAGLVIEPGKVGFPVFGDDELTPDVTEGFKAGEAFYFRFYDRSQNKEYTAGVQGLPADSIFWKNNDFTVIENEVKVPGVMSVVNPGIQFVDEGDAVAFDLKVSGAAQGAAISMAYMAVEHLPGNAPEIAYNAQTKIGRLTWQTDLNSSGKHQVGVMTWAILNADTTKEFVIVPVQVDNVNQAPTLIRANLPADLADDNILTMAKNQPPIVLNPFIWFSDPDGDQIMIDREANNADLLRHEIDYVNQKFTISTIRDQVGETVFIFRANDLVERAPGFDGLLGRKARTLDSDASNFGPVRDLITEYRFTVKLIDGRRPVVAAEGVPLQVITEDSQNNAVGDLDDFISDPDGGALAFQALDVPQEHLTVNIDQNSHQMTVTSAMKDFWSPDILSFSIKATDPTALTVFTPVTVQITSINDAPEDFALLTPEKKAHVSNTEFDGGPWRENLEFTWEMSMQNEWEIGGITYKLFAYLGQDFVNSIEIPIPVEDGEKYVVGREEFVTMTKGRLDQSKTYTWWVKAFDEEGAITSTEPFTFVLPSVDVQSEYTSIPTKLEFNGNYPNPFNGLTSVKFGVPTTGAVEVTIFDMTGRRISTLLSGNLGAGWHTASWNASHLPTGMYLVRIATANEQIMKKAVLIK